MCEQNITYANHTEQTQETPRPRTVGAPLTPSGRSREQSRPQPTLAATSLGALRVGRWLGCQSIARLAGLVLLVFSISVSLKAQTCTYHATTSTFASVFSKAAGGSTICLAAGNYGNFNGAVESSMVTIESDASNGGTQSNVIFGGLNLSPAEYLTFNALTVSGGATVGSSSTTAYHIYFTNVTFTGASGLCIYQPNDVNQDTLVNNATFANVGQSCTEGRLGIIGNNNAATWTNTNGIVIENSTFSGSGNSIPNDCADGVNITGGANGTQIGPGNTFTQIVESSCVAHVDSIQFYGAHSTTVTGNFFYITSDAIMSPDCNGSPMTVTNNVFVQDPGSATSEVIEAGGNGDVFDHNTFAGTNTAPRFGNPNSCGLDTNITITNNILVNGIDLTDGQSASTFTENYNLIPGGGTGSHTISGLPTFTGGSSPTTYAGFALAPTSLGYLLASNGSNIGANVGSTSTPTSPSSPTGTGTTTSLPSPPTSLTAVAE